MYVYYALVGLKSFFFLMRFNWLEKVQSYVGGYGAEEEVSN